MVISLFEREKEKEEDEYVVCRIVDFILTFKSNRVGWLRKRFESKSKMNGKRVAMQEEEGDPANLAEKAKRGEEDQTRRDRVSIYRSYLSSKKD